MQKLLFPLILIVLQFGAGLMYAIYKDGWQAVYFTTAAILNLAVIMMGN